MMNFNRDRRPARSDRPMHRAVCASCGNECEVPFRPSGDRPVYCSRCFEDNPRQDSRRSGPVNSQRSNFGDRNDRRMFDAICDKCGDKCTVPFQPTSGKPIFCNKCFEAKNDRNPRNNDYKEQFVTLNHKLDKILRILEPVIAKDEIVEITKPVKKAKPKKTSPAKKAEK